MASKLPTTPVRGMRDLLPDECALRDAASATILDVYRKHGFQRIETPALEHMPLLASSQGGENEKLIFKILKRGEKLQLDRTPLHEADLVDAGLRFDLTVPLARYYAAHQAELPQPFKAIQIGPVWRAERPQKGRYRQFTQCDIDVLGDPGEAAEIESILATTDALAALGLTGFTVSVNDRRLLTAMAREAGVPADQEDTFFIALDKLDKVGAEGVAEELSRSGLPAGAVTAARALAGGAPIDAGLHPEAASALAAIESVVGGQLGAHGRVVSQPSLVRGMGYYTGPIFEISVEDQPFAIAGGGRYDKMIGRLIGREVPATGFSIGFERLILVLTERGWRPEQDLQRIALLYDGAVAELSEVMAEAGRLRTGGAVVTTIAQRKKAGKQRAELERQGWEPRAYPQDAPAS